MKTFVMLRALQVLDPISAIIVVDVQNDFITGSLAVKDCPAGMHCVVVTSCNVFQVKMAKQLYQ